MLAVEQSPEWTQEAIMDAVVRGVGFYVANHPNILC